MAEHGREQAYKERKRGHAIEKRIIVLADGTAQSSCGSAATAPTNIGRFARSIETSQAATENEDEIPQIVLYQTGVGTDGVAWLDNVLAGTFGLGLNTHILEAYSFIAHNYEEGDTVWLFGFSRGAFTARSLASFICNAGLLTKDSLAYLPLLWKLYKERRNVKEKITAFEANRDELIRKGATFHERVPIDFVGLFDAVGSIGLPRSWLTKLLSWLPYNSDTLSSDEHGYHDTSFRIPSKHEKHRRAIIHNAVQALALDENRMSFAPTLLYFPELPEHEAITGTDGAPDITQVWFPGVHADIGGGYSRAYQDLSDTTFTWMLSQAQKVGLKFHPKFAEHLKRPTYECLDPYDLGKDANTKPLTENKYACATQHDEFHTAKFVMGGSETRKPGEYFLGRKDRESKGRPYKTYEQMHASVRLRLKLKRDWVPAALDGFTLTKGVDEQSNRKSWHWKKTVVKDGVEVEIKIPEADLDDEELQLFDSEAKNCFEADEELNGFTVHAKPTGLIAWYFDSWVTQYKQRFVR